MNLNRPNDFFDRMRVEDCRVTARLQKQKIDKLKSALNNLLNDCIKSDGGKLTDSIMKEAAKTLSDT